MFSADFQFAQMDLARASIELIRVLRTLINSIAKNLHKLQICLRFYSFYKKLYIQANYTIPLIFQIYKIADCAVFIIVIYVFKVPFIADCKKTPAP